MKQSKGHTFWNKLLKLAIALVVAFAIFRAGMFVQTILPGTEETYNGQLLFDEVNEHRVSVGLKPFTLDPNLCSTLNERVNAYIIYNDHTGVEEWVAKRKFEEQGYTLLGEDLVTAQTAEEAVQKLLGSPGHRLDIENPERNVACTFVRDAADHFGASVIFMAKK